MSNVLLQSIDYFKECSLEAFHQFPFTQQVLSIDDLAAHLNSKRFAKWWKRLSKISDKVHVKFDYVYLLAQHGDAIRLSHGQESNLIYLAYLNEVERSIKALNGHFNLSGFKPKLIAPSDERNVEALNAISELLLMRYYYDRGQLADIEAVFYKKNPDEPNEKGKDSDLLITIGNLPVFLELMTNLDLKFGSDVMPYNSSTSFVDPRYHQKKQTLETKVKSKWVDKFEEAYEENVCKLGLQQSYAVAVDSRYYPMLSLPMVYKLSDGVPINPNLFRDLPGLFGILYCESKELSDGSGLFYRVEPHWVFPYSTYINRYGYITLSEAANILEYNEEKVIELLDTRKIDGEIVQGEQLVYEGSINIYKFENIQKKLLSPVELPEYINQELILIYRGSGGFQRTPAGEHCAVLQTKYEKVRLVEIVEKRGKYTIAFKVKNESGEHVIRIGEEPGFNGILIDA